MNRTDLIKQLYNLLLDVREELKLLEIGIRMKDTPNVYDPTIRARLEIGIRMAENYLKELK